MAEQGTIDPQEILAYARDLLKDATSVKTLEIAAFLMAFSLKNALTAIVVDSTSQLPSVRTMPALIQQVEQADNYDIQQ